MGETNSLHLPSLNDWANLEGKNLEPKSMNQSETRSGATPLPLSGESGVTPLQLNEDTQGRMGYACQWPPLSDPIGPSQSHPSFGGRETTIPEENMAQIKDWLETGQSITAEEWLKLTDPKNYQ